MQIPLFIHLDLSSLHVFSLSFKNGHIKKEARYTPVEDLGSIGLVLVEMAMGPERFRKHTSKPRGETVYERCPNLTDRLIAHLLLETTDPLSSDTREALDSVPHSVLRFLSAVGRLQRQAAVRGPISPQKSGNGDADMEDVSQQQAAPRRPTQPEVCAMVKYEELKGLFK